MTVFADSSALVKLYADELGSADVRVLSDIVISDLARVEVVAALWRKHRTGALPAVDARALVALFEAELFSTVKIPQRFTSIAITPAILDSAARLVAVHGLRAYDSVQLATAVAVRGADPTCTDFAAFDEQLRNAAAVEGFHLVP